MLEGIDFTVSYAPVANIQSIRVIIAIAAAEGMTIHILDISNAFQSTVIAYPKERHYISLPAQYLQWFRRKWPTHPLASSKSSDLVLQCLKSIQGTKPAGRMWYDLFSSVLRSLGMQRSDSDHGVFSWIYNKLKSLIALATDDILVATQHKSCVDKIRASIDDMFDYTYNSGMQLKFLNISIIQSSLWHQY